MQNNDTLVKLDISDNLNHAHSISQSLQNDILQHISRMVQYNTGIRDLNLGKMGITDWAVCDYLVHGIKANKTIEVLDLSCNKISRDGGVAICQALEGHTSIRVLKLGCNALQDEGAFAVAQLLKNNSVLQEYVLSGHFRHVVFNHKYLKIAFGLQQDNRKGNYGNFGSLDH